mgnify:CR=1 FL=1
MRKSEYTASLKQKIGARIQIKLEYQSEIENLFGQAGIAPIHKELRDGNILYLFSKDQIAALAATGLLENVPLHWRAHYAIAGEPPIVNQ